MGGGYLPGTIPQALGALSVLLASINVSGGFVISKRMLDMFKRGFFTCSLHCRGYSQVECAGPTDPPEYNWLYSIPAAVFTGGFLLAAQTGFAGLVQAGYLASSILCISTLHFVRPDPSNSHAVSIRFPFRTCLPVYCKARQRAWNVGCWLGFRYILGCRWISTSRPRAIRYAGRCRRDDWHDHWEEDYCYGTTPDGRRLAPFFLDRYGK